MPEKPNQHNSVDVIYLEADSEITEAIDKLKSARGREVRIAVPGRSTMLQSAVNLKLLKKTAHNGGKKLVLISSDRATLSLAAGLGLLVAKNVKAEALLPSSAMAPPQSSHEPVVIDQAAEETKNSRSSSSSSRSSSRSKNSSSDDTDNNYIDLSEDGSSDSDIQKASAGHSKKSKQSPKIPNFMGLNKKISITVAAFAVFIMLMLAYVFLPTAKVTLLAKAQKTPVNVEFTLDSTVRKSDYSQGLVAANQLTVTKDLSAQYTATGKKDVGTKATGSISVKNCDDTSTHSVPANTVMTSNGKTFTTNSAIVVPAGSAGGGIVNCSATVNVAVTATQSGDTYNVSNASFSVAGQPSKVTGTGSTSGGTTKIAVVVTQADIDKAQKEMIDSASQNAKQDVESKAGSDERFFPETFTSSVSGLTTSAPVDSESSGGTVSAKVKYSELSANNTDLDNLFTEQIKTQIPGSNQLYQSGWKDAKYSAKPSSSEKAEVKAVGNAFYGQAIDIKQVARDLSGKAKKDATDVVTPKYPQVTGVQVESNPALAPNIPFFANRITVEIKVNTD